MNVRALLLTTGVVIAVAGMLGVVAFAQREIAGDASSGQSCK